MRDEKGHWGRKRERPGGNRCENNPIMLYAFAKIANKIDYSV